MVGVFGFLASHGSDARAPQLGSFAVSEPEDDRSRLALAMEWVSVVTTISAEMVVPGFLGYGLDWLCGTRVVFLMLGMAGGLTLALWHLVRLSPARNGKPPASGKPPNERTPL